MSKCLCGCFLIVCLVGVVVPLQSQEADPTPNPGADLERAVELNPDDRSAIVELANHFFDEEEWSRAETLYERALEIDDADPNVLTDLAIVQRILGEPKLSLHTLDQALELKPDHWQAVYNKAVVLLFDLDQSDVARDLIARLEEMRADFPDIPDLQRLREAFPADEPAASTQISPELEAAAREFVRRQNPPECLDEIYQQATHGAVMAVENSIQPVIGRAITDSERTRLTVLCNEMMREALPLLEIEEVMYPIVAKHLTLEELNKLNAFLATPVGQKFVSVNAALIREGQAAGELLGERLADSEVGKKFSAKLERQFPQWFSTSEQEERTQGKQGGPTHDEGEPSVDRGAHQNSSPYPS